MLLADAPRLRRLAFRAGVLGVAAVAVLHVLYYFPRVVDDAYIFFRYAENLALGDGLVYNVGERVEGFSSPLWVFLLAGGKLVGVGTVTFCKLLSLVALFALFTGVWRFSRERLAVSRPAALLGCAFLALDSYVISWGMWGLETPAYLALMVWTALLLGRAADAPARGRGLGTAAVGAAFVLCRPEAPMFFALLWAGTVLEPLRRDAIRERLRRLILPGLAVAAAFGAWLLFRRAYYGHWVPNTYFAKQGSGLSPHHLQALWGQGASVVELVLLWGGGILGLVLAVVRRVWAPVLVASGSVFFTAFVLTDWMPNVRHLLPVYVFLPLAWVWAVDRLGRRGRPDGSSREARGACPPTRPPEPRRRRKPRQGRWRARTALAAAGTVVVLAAGVQIARIDARYSPWDFESHGEGVRWILPKTATSWTDTWLCLGRIRPPHVRAMDPFEMGMIVQVYRLLEADARPLEDTWYVGRDIGRVGWLAPASIFDTDGLFTPVVAADPRWRTDRLVGPELVRAAMARPVVMTELMDGWELAVRAEPLMRLPYEPSVPGEWGLLAARGREQPAADEIRRRYDWAVRRLPEWFYVMTLYGEAVGAALERRRDLVNEVLSDNEEFTVATAPAGLEGGPLVLENVGTLLGCDVTPKVVAPGDEVVVTCYYRAYGGVRERYRVFLHLEGVDNPMRWQGDHDPLGGFYPTDRWRAGETVRDAARVWIPSDARAGPVQVWVGLFAGGRRVPAFPSERVDGTGRGRGPVFRIVQR